jgi:hypothetical protein
MISLPSIRLKGCEPGLFLWLGIRESVYSNGVVSHAMYCAKRAGKACTCGVVGASETGLTIGCGDHRCWNGCGTSHGPLTPAFCYTLCR